LLERVGGGLYVVATPIGNLSDISARALLVLGEADRVLAEDTRVTANLLRLLGIEKKRLYSLRGANAVGEQHLLSWLKEGEVVALLSDAGTPNVSDPGRNMVGAAVSIGYAPHVVPGPSAVTAIVSVCNFRSDRFYFHGFLPAKRSERMRVLSDLSKRSEATIFFEAPHRVQETFLDLLDTYRSDRKAVVGREMTKMYEQLFYGTLESVMSEVVASPLRGEYSIALEGAEGDNADDDDRNIKLLTEMLKKGIGVRSALEVLVEVFGVSKSRYYDIGIEIQRDLKSQMGD